MSSDYSPSAKYPGEERRIHRVFVTRNTEYHLRRDRCVAVRNRQTGEFYDDHRALNRTVAGAVRFHGQGMSAQPTMPRVGDAMCFDGLNVVTTTVESIERPTQDTVARYRRDATGTGRRPIGV